MRDRGQIIARLSNPVWFLFFLLLPSAFYFSDSHYWFLIQLLLQFVICIVGVSIPSYRFAAIVALCAVLLHNTPLLLTNQRYSPDCCKRIDRLYGTVKRRGPLNTTTLDLIRVRIDCGDRSFGHPMATIHLSPKDASGLWWFDAGDEIEVKHVTPISSNVFLIELKTEKGFRSFNLSRQNSIRHRSRLVVYLQSKARYYLDGFPLFIFKALVMADRSGMPKEWKHRFQRLGLSHLFAISGMHIGILFLWISISLRWLFSFALPGVEKGYGVLCIDLVSLFLIFYFSRVIGMPISARRSLIMLTWWIITKHFTPFHSLWFILFGTASIIVLKDPATVGQLSFQLSFLSVAGILLIGSFLPAPSIKDSPLLKLAKIATATFIVSAWLSVFTLPLVLQLSSAVSLASPVNNVFHILFLCFIFLPLLMVTSLYTLLGFFVGGGGGEFYFYSMVNATGRVWELATRWNSDWNRLFIVYHDSKWSGAESTLYWLALTLIALLLRTLSVRRIVEE